MKLTVNGKPRDAADEGSILDFLKAQNVNPMLIAVEHNGEIIRRERYGEVALHEGDTLEIVHMVGGG
jgi:thiamine biosynthesis protein ThiS